MIVSLQLLILQLLRIYNRFVIFYYSQPPKCGSLLMLLIFFVSLELFGAFGAFEILFPAGLL